MVMRMIAAGNWVGRTLCCATLGVVLLHVAGGCSSGPAKVDITGKIVKDGQPLKVSKNGQVQIWFKSESKDPLTAMAKRAVADDNGDFELKGIPAGKYRIEVAQVDPITVPGRESANDLLKGAFTKNTPIVRDVDKNGQVIEIDLAKEGK